MTQKYHSAKEIDPEFIPSLEQLLSDCVPSFEWLKDFEENSPENIHFHYYLFFGDSHNSPIGFAQVALEQKKTNQTGFFNRLIKKTTTKLKMAKWSVPGSYQEALVVEPRYKMIALAKAYDLIQDFSKRDDITSQTFKFGIAYSDIPYEFQDQIHQKRELNIPDTLVKNQASYQEYLASLSPHVFKEIKNNWKVLHQENIYLNQSENFKDLFAYKDNGAQLYRELKNQKKIKSYLNLKTTFISIENNNSIIAIIFLIKGISRHYFYDYLMIGENIDGKTLDQIAIMNFYEKDDSHRLHMLYSPDNVQAYAEFGFTFRKQIELSYSK